MNRSTAKLLVPIFILVAYYAIYMNSCKAIGQITKPIYIENALRGKEYAQSVTIINTEDREVVVDVSARGGISDWTKFYAAADEKDATTTVVIPTGEKSVLTASFKLPDDLANGDYAGVIVAYQRADKSISEKATTTIIAQEVVREVKITVSDKEIIDFKVSIIPKSYDISQGSDLPVRFIYDNQGNVEIFPQIQLKILKDNNQISNVIFPYPDGISGVKPGGKREIPEVLLDANKLESGKYVAQMDFLINGQPKVSDSFGFTVREEDVRQVLGTKTNGFLDGYAVWQKAVLAIATILLAASVVILMIARSKKLAAKSPGKK